MLAVKSVNVRDNFKEWCDKISMGETVVISRPRNEKYLHDKRIRI